MDSRDILAGQMSGYRDAQKTAHRTDVAITATPSNKHHRVLGNPQQKRWEEPQRTRRPSDELPDSDHELERIVVHVRVLLAPLAVAHALLYILSSIADKLYIGGMHPGGDPCRW